MTQPSHAAAPHVGMVGVPGVQIDGVLGQGGFATVYAGVQLSLQRPVAVKIDSRPLHDERNRRRFLREMSAAAAISGHPHVVSLIDAGVLPDGRPYLVMERCDGGSLGVVSPQYTLLPADATRIVEAVSSALGAAHAVGVLHRDIKPGNILIDAYGSPRLTDFGIAAIQREEQEPSVTLEALTPAFAPPEAFTMAPPTAAGDVWSMGAVLLTLITGRGPRTGHNGRSRSLPEIFQSLDDPIATDDPRIPVPLQMVINRAMHPDPATRYQDGAELTAALSGVLPHLGEGRVAVSGPMVTTTIARPQTAPPSVPAAASTHPRSPFLPLAIGAVVGSVVMAGALWGVGAFGRADEPTAEVTVTHEVTPTPESTQATAMPTETTPTPSPGPTSSAPAATHPVATPAQFNADGIPYSPNMPWELGACLQGTIDDQGVSTAMVVDCPGGTWKVFAGGDYAPDNPGTTSAEALALDTQVIVVCSDEYAELYGLDTSVEYEIRVLGPDTEDWQRGERGFSCVFETL